MNLCCSRAVADGLSSGFLTRQREMKSENSELNLSGSFRVGAGFVGIMNIAFGGREEGGMELRQFLSG